MHLFQFNPSLHIVLHLLARNEACKRKHLTDRVKNLNFVFIFGEIKPAETNPLLPQQLNIPI